MVGVRDLPDGAGRTRRLTRARLNLTLRAGSTRGCVGGVAEGARGAGVAGPVCLVVARVAGCRESLRHKENDDS